MCLIIYKRVEHVWCHMHGIQWALSDSPLPCMIKHTPCDITLYLRHHASVGPAAQSHHYYCTQSLHISFCDTMGQVVTCTPCPANYTCSSLRALRLRLWYVPRRSGSCRRCRPGSPGRSTSQGAWRPSPGGSNPRCRSSWTGRSQPHTRSCPHSAWWQERGNRWQFHLKLSRTRAQRTAQTDPLIIKEE